MRPISDYADAERPVREYLTGQQGMKPEAVKTFCDIMQDLMSIDGKFFPIDASFLKYAPLDSVFKKGKTALSKYGDGQSRLAQYLHSMPEGDRTISLDQTGNLFSTTVRNALSLNEAGRSRSVPKEYFILPFIREKFTADLHWLLGKEASVVLGYIDLFLYFYCCHSIMQTIIRLDASNYTRYPDDRPVPFYYILSHESASDKRDVVCNGWSGKFHNEYVKKLYGRMQTVDMLNTLVSRDWEPVGLYPELIKEFERTPFDGHVKSQCEAILKYCRAGKLAALRNRKSSAAKADDIPMLTDLTVDSYDGFFKKLETICKGYQSLEYHERFVKRLLNLMKVRLLQTRRGRGNSVLVLDEEMLPLLVALATREQRCKLKDMYTNLEAYGIRFDISTRQAVEDLLLKLNILERRSDSGEAQYVSIVL